MACCRRNSLVLASLREERWQAEPDGEVVLGRVDWVFFGLLPLKDTKALRVILSDGEESHKCIALPFLRILSSASMGNHGGSKPPPYGIMGKVAMNSIKLALSGSEKHIAEKPQNKVGAVGIEV